ncbi:MAG: outer membrane lipoprotein carrier protein LolA [Proteobacteria bacterium]|jgi:outer membrane lipoprotein carrier protein|nr:outer membrane lipoprotein carrier protein LolA [Desulfocapsa sp.]MBU3944536.1 outer membrane lipoprotein carrier protein LolA [Pseudomonadota bacterium]MCG2744123.1 outer membrane lipoprotein carrier protein LolA [Desulfobacteraceae bacterium]MBU4028125.1 outer membrane lipoprotein carrier protein LolA [Pseudomonadota bacterium]MBU4043175.1 outer membrane lipoprotein carrier protein LolA [Pseudomonadota bacterium]
MKPFLTQPSLGARTLLLSLSALIFLLLHQPLFAGLNVIESPEDIARRLQQNYDQIKSLSFHFTQSTEGELSGRPQQGSGTAWFVKEKKSKGFSGTVGKMRWDYTSPDKQILVSDGVDFSMYFAKLEQMIISPAESMQTDITYAFFTGAGNLLKDFTISAPNPAFTPRKEDAGRYKVIKLIPKENKSQVSEIHLWVTPDSLIQRMEILDHFETKTTLEFSNLETNTLPTDDPKAMDALFSFTPPEGTEIIYQ